MRKPSSGQASFLDDERQGAYGPTTAVIEPTDPHVGETEAPRLTGQNAAILERLRQGPTTNVILATIALKYTSRLSDLRAAGCTIDIIHRDHKTGIVTYQLTSEPKS